MQILPLEIPPFPGVPAFPGHPQPIWVLLRDRLVRLSPSHHQQVLSQSPKGGGTRARVRLCVCTALAFVPRQGQAWKLWLCEPPNILI